MSAGDQERIWVLLEGGETLTDIGTAIGRSITTVRSFVLRHGGQRPPKPAVWSDKRMCLPDREEISRGLALEETFRTIASRIGRAPSTVSREVNANGGRCAYQAVDAKASVRERVKRPKKRRLECDRKLRRVVEAGLKELWSPAQISNTLRLDYPTDETMRVSPETIYEAIYQGVIDREPQLCLRTKRRRRVHRHRRKATGPGVIKNRVMIKDRPAHIEDRLEVGHWEGDLIVGNGSTALATLVERMTRYTVLVQLPGRSQPVDASPRRPRLAGRDYRSLHPGRYAGYEWPGFCGSLGPWSIQSNLTVFRKPGRPPSLNPTLEGTHGRLPPLLA